MGNFSAQVERDGGATTIFLHGELDMATVPDLERELKGVEGRVCFDCAELSFVDSSGLAVFSRADRNGGATLRNVTPNVRRVLEVVALEHLVAET
jgi:anti-anti-sigma factor